MGGDGQRGGAARTGVDLGGTKIEAIVLDASGRERARRRAPTPRGDYEAGVRAIAALVEETERAAGVSPTFAGAPRPVGFGVPGSLSPATGLIRNANSTWLNGRPLAADLAAALGRPVLLENDAKCLAASEAADGAARGARVAWAIILGTGVGSGIAVDGRPLRGRNAIAGEWGHMPLPGAGADEPARPCYCGRAGCVETCCSGPALAAEYVAAGGPAGATAQEVARAMRAGDPVARAVWRRYVRRLGKAMASVINVLDPDVIVLGGGISNIDELYEALPAAIRPHLFSDVFDTPLRRAMHGDSSGVRGAAWLWTPPAYADA